MGVCINCHLRYEKSFSDEVEITLVCGYKDKYLEDSLILCVLSMLMVERSSLSYMMFLPPGFGLVCGTRHEYLVALL